MVRNGGVSCMEASPRCKKGQRRVDVRVQRRVEELGYALALAWYRSVSPLEGGGKNTGCVAQIEDRIRSDSNARTSYSATCYGTDSGDI